MTAGEVYTVSSYPFVRCVASTYDVDGPCEFLSWKPGVVFRAVGPYGEDSEGIAHGLGQMLMTVVSTHKPGRYPARVFYTRKWVNPDGVAFGKTGLRIVTQEKFNRLAKGYAHPFSMSEPLPEEVA
jgi:hypothetical protein